MDVTGLGFAVVAEARTLVQSTVTRIDNYGKGPDKFKTLGTNLQRLTENIDDIKSILASSPHALPTSVNGVFNRTFSRVNESLENLSDIVENDFSKVFPPPGSGFLKKMRSSVHRVTRATSLSDKMKSVETQIKEASDHLSHLTTVLSIALKVDDVIPPKLDNLSVIDPWNEEYRPATNAPALSCIIKLDFESKDAEGIFITPEGILKHKVLASISPKTITAAVGVLNPAYGLIGMAGVGKTIALQGLAGDEDIRTRFPDGIHYMTLGPEATAESVIQEITHAMAITGATASVAMVQNSTSLRKAVAHGCTWFRDKKCLFLVDDIWPTDMCQTGYLTDLRQLLRESPNSRMAVSTRSVKIALEAGSVVNFGAREPLGGVSLGIFMKYATCSMTMCNALDTGDQLPPAVTKILTWCGGLPIALSVTGSAVALLLRNVGSLERACEIYVTDFEGREMNVGDEEDPQGTRLNDSIRLSLKYLEVEFSKWKDRRAVDTKHTISDLYTSLCVFSNQVWIPVSVLSRMWQLNERSSMDVVQLFCGLSLGSLSFRRISDGKMEKAGLVLHDLHLYFCKKQAGLKSSEPLWHSALLNGFLDAPSDSEFLDPCTQSAQELVHATPRFWWSIPDDGYTHANLSRHLFQSGRALELAALLLEARWTNVRGKLGGILGLKTDFEILNKLLEPNACCDGENCPSRGIRKSFQFVLKAMQLSWGSFSDGHRTFEFQMCGRLLSLRNDDVIVDAAMKSFEAHTPKPYLMPVSRCFPELNSAQIWEIPVGGSCGCVARSPCGRYIAAGAGHDIVIADPITGDVLKRLKGHRKNLRCIRFTSGSSKLVSGSEDNTAAVWAWENPDEPVLVLKGHSHWVTSVDVSNDGECIVSGSWDGTVRLWNGLTGVQTSEIVQSSSVWCVALCSEDKKLAIGLDNGTVKVLDSTTGDTVFEYAKAHTKRVTSVMFCSDLGLMATCSWDKTIRLWDTEKWMAHGSPIAVHTHWVTSVAFSVDGLQLVSGSYDGTIRLWDVAPGESFQVSSNRSILRERNIFSSDMVDSVTFTCGGERIVSASYGGFARIWDATFVSEEKQQCLGHRAPVFGVSISPDGQRVATGSDDKTIRLWDSQTGAQIGNALEGHTHGVTCVSFSPDGQYLVSGSWDRTLRMWNTTNSVQVGIPFEGHSFWVRCVSFSADGLRIVSGGGDKTVRLWNAETHEQIGDPLIGHRSWVRYICESSDGRFVVSRDLARRKEQQETIIWSLNCHAIVWRSKECSRNSNNRITSIQAENVIRNCGHDAPHLWPNSFAECTAEIISGTYTIYSNVCGDEVPLGNLPSYSIAWKYDTIAKMFVAGLDSGGVAICRLVV